MAKRKPPLPNSDDGDPKTIKEVKSRQQQESHLGVRLNVTDFVRATEQVAVLLSLVSGRGLKTDKTYRAWATKYLLGYLRASFCRPRFCHRACEEESADSVVAEQWSRSLKGVAHDEGRGERYTAVGVESPSFKKDGKVVPWELYATRFRGAPVPVHFDQVDLDVAAIPLDGATNLHSGKPGSVSVIVAGEQDCFVADRFFDDPEALAPSYFVVVANRYSGPSSEDKCFWPNPPGAPQRFQKRNDGIDTISEFAEFALNKLATGAGRTLGPAIAWIEPSVKLPRPVTLKGRRFEILSGSSIAGAIATLRSSRQVDMAFLYAKPIHLIAISLAAKVLKGSVFAIPVGPGGAAIDNPRVRTEIDFVRRKRAFLCMTGITRTRALERVRLLRDDRILTDSMTLSLATGSVRDIAHDFSVKEALFRNAKGDSCLASDLISEFVRVDVGEKDWPARVAGATVQA